MQLLIIDDHAGIRDLIAATAKHYVSDIRQFSCADEVIEHAECFHPDCATVDLRMPGTDGLAALRRLRALYPEAHLIMFTQFDQPSIRERALRAGANELIGKTELSDLAISLEELSKRHDGDAVNAPQQSSGGEQGWRWASDGLPDPHPGLQNPTLCDAERHSTTTPGRMTAAQEIEIMIATLSHDLRAPLRAIDAYMRLLQYELGESTNQNALAYIERSCRSVEMAQQLLHELLDFLRCRHAPLHWEELDLSVMAQNIVDELRVIEPSRCVEVQIQSGMRACGDPPLVQRLLHNLIGNAWKFTEHVSDARVAFTMDQSSGERSFCVQDNGCGFELEEAEQMFEPFRRGSTQQRYQGYGVGLAIAKQIVEAHGGSIVAKSEPHSGARFCFTLPPRAM